MRAPPAAAEGSVDIELPCATVAAADGDCSRADTVRRQHGAEAGVVGEKGGALARPQGAPGSGWPGPAGFGARSASIWVADLDYERVENCFWLPGHQCSLQLFFL
jgi:hypothetical protein